jgi:hypothetical protein
MLNPCLTLGLQSVQNGQRPQEAKRQAELDKALASGRFLSSLPGLAKTKIHVDPGLKRWVISKAKVLFRLPRRLVTP